MKSGSQASACNPLDSEDNIRPTSTDIPARIDRLPWSRRHWLIVAGLGITWILDGLEVTIVGSMCGILQQPCTLGFSSSEIGFTGTAYLIGAVLGALLFGYLTDTLGRKKLFTVTLVLYLCATGLTAISWNLWSFAFFRFFTGAGIGGEYAAINSAVDELIPARVRGRVDLLINSTFWLGTAVGSFASVFFLNVNIFPINVGWRLAFAVGAVLGLVILMMRRFIPESPRWLITHSRFEEAEQIVKEMEHQIKKEANIAKLPKPGGTVLIYPRCDEIRLGRMLKTILGSYADRSILGLSLMIAQAFFYNGVSFTLPLLLTLHYGVPPDRLGLYLLPFAFGNFLGPLLMGRFFDTYGRRPMIAITYSLSGILLIISGYLFTLNSFTVMTQTFVWMVIFFIASSAASSAYLTVSEIFPLETRGMAIALFYALGTGVGGVAAPFIFGLLLESGSRMNIFYGYLAGALLMIGAGIVGLILGVDAEQKSLEEIAKPLSSGG